TTTTNENGNYYFGGLGIDSTYIVKVDTTTLPNGGIGLTNTVDPDLGADSTSQFTITATELIQLDQDFGYQATTPNTISGTIWKDLDGDGFMDATEVEGLAGITITLYDEFGNIVATTTTDENGDYSFPGLPDGTYTVDVTDDANLLNGYWHSEGTAGVDGYSQSDPYTVAVSGGELVESDFGYYQTPASVGSFVWNDIDADGIQDTGETGIANLKVTLTITYPNGDEVVLVTFTDANGEYSFDNLLLDENYNGAGPGEPTFTLTAEIPSGYYVSEANVGVDDTVDSDGAWSEAGSTVTLASGTLVMGVENLDVDFGLTASPTALFLPTNFKADYANGGVRLSWDSQNPIIRRFRIEVSNEASIEREWAELAVVNAEFGTIHYEWFDQNTVPGIVYNYKLIVIYDGDTYEVGPASITGPFNTFVPLINK
ncbi:MAG: SdrD B-like domain-containing protein, partial [Brevefilum sp.]|nr:SdrD B-like domain-containing protein [Brevefilum sp.]